MANHFLKNQKITDIMKNRILFENLCLKNINEYKIEPLTLTIT